MRPPLVEERIATLAVCVLLGEERLRVRRHAKHAAGGLG